MKKTLALAGNPNVGKSTVFNALTGLRQHTGNWPGKTVGGAKGYCDYKGNRYEIVDLPGCYSLLAHSGEEEIARNYICFEHPDVVIAVCDATCLERNLNLVLQIIEATEQVIVCVNLMDEAEKKQIHLNLELLSEELGVPVIGTVAREAAGIEQIFSGVYKIQREEQKSSVIEYPGILEEALEIVEPAVRWVTGDKENTRWLSIRLLDGDEGLKQMTEEYLGYSLSEREEVSEALEEAWKCIGREGYTDEDVRDMVACTYIRNAEKIARKVVTFGKKNCAERDRRLDRIFTSKITGFPVMFLLLLFIFWLTISGANLPSQLLARGALRLETKLVEAAVAVGLSKAVYEPLIFGVYRVTAWVVSVMLPPMAIFFPLFTLLEDFGYLPRIAYNLDRCFQRCHACGKQALTMCMECVILQIILSRFLCVHHL